MARNPILGGCEPAAPPSGKVFQPIRSLINETQELGPEDYRGILLVLKANLSTSLLSGNISYRVPSTHALAIERITPHLIITDFSAETASLGNIGTSAVTGTLTFVDRMMVKLMNCKVTLQNSDRNQPVFDNGSPTLLSLHLNPVDWTAKPHIVPPGELLDGTVALVDTADTAITGAETEYGIIIVGTLVRVKRS